MSHVRMFEFEYWRVVPELVIPDNEKAAIDSVGAAVVALLYLHEQSPYRRRGRRVHPLRPGVFQLD